VRDVWVNAAAGNPVEALLGDVPAEFRDWVRGIDAGLRRAFVRIAVEAGAVLVQSFGDRGEAVRWVATQQYPAVMLAMLDGGNYRPLIWEMLKPADVRRPDSAGTA